jgi:CRP/FNR family transcriptional regulator
MLAKGTFFAISHPSGAVTSQFLPASGAKVDKQFIKVACSNCNMRELCMPIGLNVSELNRVDELVTKRPFVKRGSALFRVGDAFTALYAIRSGFLKTTMSSEDGRDQVTGFQMAGEIVGLDGIASDLHTCDAIALEDTEVCALPFDRIEEIARDVKALQHHVHKIMSREIVREHGVMLLLGNMRAEERLAAFLLNLVQRLQARGFSSSDLILRMTREEIGSYLGLTLETVSRTFSKFAEDGVIIVNQRQIHIQNAEALRGMVSHELCH